MTTVIGLTGGIGSGKSTIAQYLAELGAVVIDADKVGHEAFKQGSSLYSEVVATFGKEVVSADGEIDRKKLGQVVFTNPEARERLNRMTWSRIWEMISLHIDDLRKKNTGVVVVEAFGLVEAGWHKLVDKVWVTVVSEKIVVERLKKQRGMTEKEILARIHSQPSNEERIKHADTVIRNEGSPEEVRGKVRELWTSLK